MVRSSHCPVVCCEYHWILGFISYTRQGFAADPPFWEGNMTITASGLTRAAGAAAVAAGAIFIGVQIGHPQMNTTLITSTNVYIRDQFKILMSVLGLVGITGMYLSQIRRNGVVGLVGYVLFAVAYLFILCDVYVDSYVLPHIAGSSRVYVHDLIALGTARGSVTGDVGA